LRSNTGWGKFPGLVNEQTFLHLACSMMADSSPKIPIRGVDTNHHISEVHANMNEPAHK
jgi:hypothetical protein